MYIYRFGTSKCHDHDIVTHHQSIRLRYFERANEKFNRSDQLDCVKLFSHVLF